MIRMLKYFGHYAERYLGLSLDDAIQLYLKTDLLIWSENLKAGYEKYPTAFELLTEQTIESYMEENKIWVIGLSDLFKHQFGEIVGYQTWVEGEKHSMPKAGDTIIDKQGVKHVIQYDTVSGVLGGGLDVRYDIWTGYQEEGQIPIKYSNGYTRRDTSTLEKDSVTGQMHTSSEWGAISTNYRPKYKGSYEGQIVNYWFKWEDNGWTWIGPR